MNIKNLKQAILAAEKAKDWKEMERLIGELKKERVNKKFTHKDVQLPSFLRK